jgi:hypothetical protein
MTACIHFETPAAAARCGPCTDRAKARAWAAGAPERARIALRLRAQADARQAARLERRAAAQAEAEQRIRDREAAATAAFEAEVTEALAEVETGVADAKADNLAPDASESDLYHELSGSVAHFHSPKVGAEVRRRLGF